MKVKLVIPAELSRRLFRQVPLGVLYAATELRRKGHHVEIVDLRVCEVSGGAALDGADLYIVTTTEYDTAQCYPDDLTFVRSCISQLKASTDSPIAVVGSHSTISAEATRKFTGADYALRGEHEVVIPEFIHDYPLVPTVYPADSPRFASRLEIETLEAPDFDLVAMDKYYNECVSLDHPPRLAQGGLVFANRGCPYSCSFCHLFFGRKLRKRPVAQVLDEIKIQIDNYKTVNFFFLDYTFTIDTNWVLELCDEISQRGMKFNWVCQTRTDRVETKVLRAMYQAGCRGIWYGLETPDAALRDGVRKPLEDADISRTIEMTRNSGIVPLAFLMVGFRNESQASLRRLNGWIEKLDVRYGLAPMTLRPGTPLFDEVYGEGFLDRNGWGFEDRFAGMLGVSELPIADVQWFFDLHQQNPRRLSNAVYAVPEF